VIGSATEWQAEAERESAQPLPDPADEEANRKRADVLTDKPLLLAAINERLSRPFSATFEYGLDLLIAGLRTRYVPTD
jgi:TetR/AcrR family tetracycline transcriptional repressor